MVVRGSGALSLELMGPPATKASFILEPVFYKIRVLKSTLRPLDRKVGACPRPETSASSVDLGGAEGVKVRAPIPSTQTKRPRRIAGPFNSSIFLLPSDEPFNVLLRTQARNRRSNNELHGETSISWTSPPFPSYILSILPSFCQEKNSKEVMYGRRVPLTRPSCFGGRGHLPVKVSEG